MRAYGMAQRPSVVCRLFVRRQLFLLNDFFSRTTKPISTKLGRNDAWENGIHICSNKGLAPFGAQKGAK